MSSLSKHTIILPYTTATPAGLKLVGNRYVPAISARDGLTLLFTHCTGAHKELWEPVIEHLFKSSDIASVIREAWSVDWQSHGEAAVFNEQATEVGPLTAVTEYGTGLRALLASEHLQGHQVIGIGHSAGATAILLSTLGVSVEKIAYKSITLVEPALSTRAEYEQYREGRVASLDATQKAIDSRRDIWQDRNEAIQHFKKRIPYKNWDPRILSLFAVSSLMAKISYMVDENEGRIIGKVTLKCTKIQEKKSFEDNEPHFTAVNRLSTLDASFPVHCIFGERTDIVPRHAHDSILEVRKMASIQFVKRAGHFVLQDNPDGSLYV
ncbi:alpha/beta-hydrolase [Laetiporus sulphureus 93-53]|uniref:Alpha/beta-hydrolase n=1 Tax=Laetiporus sulphureus 93-53 TaxID=1314785 RepID=A0A165FI12_9APHY|nr:alpha/beta-hydrolase [Laetiporus sulphureus 93-53]KZT09001.1 alpha/beta-hydrolase [Laetiporus sulphureus 93-53]